jgi:cell wall-associated NlpC family hydrolase
MISVERKKFRFVLLDILNETDFYIAGSPDEKKTVLQIDMEAKTAEWKEKSNKPVSKYADTTKLVKVAEFWVGKDFKPGQTEQCCYFVRHCLKEAGLNIGVTKKPSDGLSTSEGYANSLAGDDIGTKIEKISSLMPGDLVFFKNTYGNWPDGTITHIGIYVGNGNFVHRPTASRPVEKAYLESYGHFREGRRLLK